MARLATEQARGILEIAREPGEAGRRRQRWRRYDRQPARTVPKRGGFDSPVLEEIGHAAIAVVMRATIRTRGLVDGLRVLRQLFDDAIVGMVRGAREGTSYATRPVHTYACLIRATRFSASKKVSQTLRWLASVFLPAAVTR